MVPTYVSKTGFIILWWYCSGNEGLLICDKVEVLFVCDKVEVLFVCDKVEVLFICAKVEVYFKVLGYCSIYVRHSSYYFVVRIRLGSNVELHMSRTQCKLGKSFCLSSFALSSADVKFDVCPGLYWPRLMYNIGLYREFKVYNLARARRRDL